jgi:hypothetical protein
MMRLIALAFALTLASFAQAMPLAPLHQQDKMVITVREACGAGMHMVNGTCVRTHARRAASRCARGVTCWSDVLDGGTARLSIFKRTAKRQAPVRAIMHG